jgi:hypothetical protein
VKLRTNEVRHHPRRPTPVAFALLTAVAGSGVLAPWSALSDTPPDLQGWIDFRAAAVGDTVLLPVLIGTLVAAGRAHRAGLAGSRWIWLVGIAGLVGGMALQIGWLVDSSPQLNWTIQEPHRFTAAGWYHAVFLCVMCASLAALAGRLIIGRRSERRRGRFAITISYAIIGFAILQTLDVVAPAGPVVDGMSTSGALSGVLTVITGMIGVACLVPRGPGADRLHYFRSCAVGASFAVLLGVTSYTWPDNAEAAFAVAGGLSVITYVIDHQARRAAAPSPHLGEQKTAPRG